MGRLKVKKLDALEQYGRRLILEIAGVPVKDGDNKNRIVVEVSKPANAEITKHQIFTSHHLVAKPKRNAIDLAAQYVSLSIIVRFIRRHIRNRFYANRQNLRNANLKHFSQIPY